MSGIYIPGAEMPTEHTLWMVVHTDGTVEYNRTGVWNTLDEKAITVPDNWRLIDADALVDMLEKYKTEYALKAEADIVHLHKAWGLYEAELMAESLPTIISADKEDKN